MKKFSIVIIAVLLVLGFSMQARAEVSASAYGGKTGYEQQVYVEMMNNSGSEVSSNCVVVLDVSGTGVTAGTTLGGYFTTATTAGNSYIVGVTDETIADGSVGRICVRGPHIVRFTAAPTAADTVSNGTTAGWATTQTSTANKYGYLGIALKATATTEANYGSTMWWVYVRPTVQ